ncbi:hypothetical protein wTpre_1420 [Wolbachia endosymbiont of Trichogramma pretiosum]|nr:hypothetical protein wTpre_1420 [Wolbachia endosymbiont of Trichogramma pretiosum]
MDVNGTIMLLDMLIRKVIDQKYVCIEEKLGKLRQAIDSQVSAPPEKSVANVGGFTINNLPIILLNSYGSLSHSNLFKRSIIETFYQAKVANIDTILG